MTVETTKYYCKNCGREIRDDEETCPDCGSTDRMINVTLSDELRIKDNIESKLNPIYDELETARNNCKIYSFLFVILASIPFMMMRLGYILNLTLASDRIIFASVGILTIVSIMYSLLFSKENKIVNEIISDVLENKEKKIRNNAEKNKGKITKKEIAKVDDLRGWADFETSLLALVFILFISISLSLFDGEYVSLFSYFTFLAGIGITFSLIYLWTRFYKIIEKYKNIYNGK